MERQDSARFLAHGKTIADILARITNDRQI
jgi:hypothetical protein